MRRIFAYDPENELPCGLKTWLAHIHQYRRLNIPRAIEYRTELDLSAQMFEQLPYPAPAFADFIDQLSAQHSR